MHHFFVNKDQMSEDRRELRISGDDYHHIARVLRMKTGEELSASVREGDGTEYRYGIEEITEDEVICRLRFIKEEKTELNAKIVLLQSLPKAGKMDMIIQKAVELGASEIIPVLASRSVSRPDEKKEKSKAVRWQAIADAASKQSRRGKLTHVRMPCSFEEAVKKAEDADVKLMPYELAESGGMDRTREIIASIPGGSKVAVFIGPEGGFSEDEVNLAKENGFKEVTMGRRILRTETAGSTMLAWLMLYLESK